MLYYNDEPVLWNKKQGLTEIEKKVREEIEGSDGIRQKYFGGNTSGKVRLLYPKGAVKNESMMGMERPKLYPIPLNSPDGQWRWTKAKKSKKGYVDSHKYITHSTVLKEKEVEFLWFLEQHSSALGRVIFIEDLEAKAKEEVEEMGADAALTFMLMNEYSPIFKNNKLIREVAEIFNVTGVSEMKENQTRIALYNAIKEGEGKDSFINFKTFDSFVNGTEARDIAHSVRVAITDKLVGYNMKDRAWYIMSGKEYSEKLMGIKAGDATLRDELLIKEVINNVNVKERLFSALGITTEDTLEGLRELDANTLKGKLRDITGEWKNIKKEEVVELICKELKIEYVPVT